MLFRSLDLEELRLLPILNVPVIRAAGLLDVAHNGEKEDLPRTAAGRQDRHGRLPDPLQGRSRGGADAARQMVAAGCVLWRPSGVVPMTKQLEKKSNTKISFPDSVFISSKILVAMPSALLSGLRGFQQGTKLVLAVAEAAIFLECDPPTRLYR